MRHLMNSASWLRAPDGAAAGSDADAAAADAQATTDDAQASDTANDAAAADGASTADTEAAPSRPEFIPEKFWNAEEGAPNVEGLANSYRELEQARLERAKQAPSEYNLPSSFKGFEDQLPAQRLTALKELAKTEGYSQKGFELLMEGTFGKPAEGRAALEKEFGDKTDETLQACATFCNTLGDHAEAVAVMTSFPGGVKLLNAWREATGDKPLPGQAEQAATAAETEAELKAKMRDPRYHDQSKRDPAFVAEVEAGFKKLHGGKQVRTAGANAGEFTGPGQVA